MARFLLEAGRELKTTNTKILAKTLNRSPSTVRTQFQRILAYLGAHSRYEALRIAEEKGFIRKHRRDTLLTTRHVYKTHYSEYKYAPDKQRR